MKNKSKIMIDDNDVELRKGLILLLNKFSKAESRVPGFPKNEDINSVMETIYPVMKKAYNFSKEESKIPGKEFITDAKQDSIVKPSGLTKRETEIIRLICGEFTNKEIADRLFISTRTVEGHREKILQKIKAKNTVGIVKYAIENMLYELENTTLN
jgi:DNA-binding CsgD family transcriptional regulator